MRTSRVAKETAKLVAALSPRSSRRFPSRSASTFTKSTSNHDLEPDESDQDSSNEAANLGASPSRKRKRIESLSDAITTTHVSDKVETWASPSKAGVSGKPKKARRQPAKRIRNANGQVSFEPPPNWEEMYNTTQEMRQQWVAPVDTMGCESLAEDHRSPRDRRFQTLVALMLSSQTKDTVTSVAMKNLQEHLPGGFTLESIIAVEPETLNSLISKVGFHNNKTRFIKAAAEILVARYASDIPDTIEGLVSLPGVGPKMAYLCMSAAWGRDEGIGVDVHVHRITNLWGWHKTNSPEETRATLESWLPRDKWHDINHLLVGFGQTYCPPIGRKCDECKLAEKGLCPSAEVGKAVLRRERKKEVVMKQESGENLVKQEVDVEMELKPVKAEDVDSPAKKRLIDIEDMAGEHPRRSTRLAA